MDKQKRSEARKTFLAARDMLLTEERETRLAAWAVYQRDGNLGKYKAAEAAGIDTMWRAYKAACAAYRAAYKQSKTARVEGSTI